MSWEITVSDRSLVAMPRWFADMCEAELRARGDVHVWTNPLTHTRRISGEGEMPRLLGSIREPAK